MVKKIILSHMTWVSVNSISHFGQMILKLHTKSTKRWVAFVSKMRQWASILLKIQMDTGSRFYRNVIRGCMLQVNLENLLKVYSLFVVYGVLDAI